MLKRLPLQILLATILLVSACQNQEEEAQTPSNLLDQSLEEALRQASGGEGSNFYILPDESDFAKIPQDPLNPLSEAKVALGKLLFHETAIALKPDHDLSLLTYSCASCHHVEAGFQAGVPQGIGEGGLGFGHRGQGRTMNPDYTAVNLDVQPIRSPTVLNVAYQPNMLWSGQFGATHRNIGTENTWTLGSPKQFNRLGFQGVETQAIAALDIHRLQISGSVAADHPEYQALFNQAFAHLPEAERINALNAGLALAAYQRTLLPNQAPFQRWLRGEREALSEAEKRGALLFFGKAGCYTCHNGPALNDMNFYGLGMKDLYQRGDAFRANVADAENRGRGGFTDRPEDMYKFKTPQLYNLKDSPFYGHGASFTSIEAVIRYKNAAVPENTTVPSSQLAPEFVPLNLSETEINELKAFIENALYDDNLYRYVPSALPSGLCFPNNDLPSKIDLGCQN